jgi:hypothetical protein
MTVNDFILLGWTAPHPTLRNGDCICAAGYSRKLNDFVRIYPVPFPFRSDIHRWDQLAMPLMRNHRDSRNESWKIKYLDRDRNALASLITKCGRTNFEAERAWLDSHLSDSIDQLNSEKRSLGFLRARNIRVGFRQRTLETEVLTTDSLFKDDNFKLEQSSLIPELEFQNLDGTWNRLQLLEWGCFEYLRKHPLNQEGLWRALMIGQDDYEHFLFVGNHNRYRTTWLGIALLHAKRSRYAQLSLLNL